MVEDNNEKKNPDYVTRYIFEVKKMKSQGKCRACHKSIYYGDIVILASKDCEYIPNQSSKMFDLIEKLRQKSDGAKNQFVHIVKVQT